MSFNLLAETKHAEFRDNCITFLEKLDIVLAEPQENYSDSELVDFIINRLREYEQTKD